MNKIARIIKVLSDKTLLAEINSENMKIFREEMIPEIYERGTGFPRVKENPNWQPFRKYMLPPAKWTIGVWTGATYTALVGSEAQGRDVIIKSDFKKSVISLKNAEYLNATLYVDGDMKAKLAENAKKRILEAIGD